MFYFYLNLGAVDYIKIQLILILYAFTNLETTLIREHNKKHSEGYNYLI